MAIHPLIPGNRFLRLTSSHSSQRQADDIDACIVVTFHLISVELRSTACCISGVQKATASIRPWRWRLDDMTGIAFRANPTALDLSISEVPMQSKFHRDTRRHSASSHARDWCRESRLTCTARFPIHPGFWKKAPSLHGPPCDPRRRERP